MGWDSEIADSSGADAGRFCEKGTVVTGRFPAATVDVTCELAKKSQASNGCLSQRGETIEVRSGGYGGPGGIASVPADALNAGATRGAIQRA